VIAFMIFWTLLMFAVGVVGGVRLLASNGVLRAATEFKWTREKLDHLFRTAAREAQTRSLLGGSPSTAARRQRGW
jgi:hypothetical protein